jgi:hypothetical protein
LLVKYGTRQMINGLKYVNIGGAIGLVAMVYHAHKIIWALDMEQKHAQLVSKSEQLSG